VGLSEFLHHGKEEGYKEGMIPSGGLLASSQILWDVCNLKSRVLLKLFTNFGHFVRVSNSPSEFQGLE